MDIRNKWSHVEWVADALQLAYQQHDWMGINDPDFLVVRGSDTSLEERTNLLDPKEHDPTPRRWQSGPVFTLEEFRTWATLVALSGGSVFLSDRISRLNQAGKELIYPVLAPTGVAARPLDVGDELRPALWHQPLAGETRLGVINWSAHERAFAVHLADWQIASPATTVDCWSGTRTPAADGVLRLTLQPHACAYLRW